MKSNRISFVTGADRGLGLALCAGLLERGWQVFAGQYMPEWPELANLMVKHPGKLVCVPLDVARIDSARAAAQVVDKTSGKVDLLINNAGILSLTMERSIREPQDYDEIHRVYDVNSLGPLRVVETFLPLMERGEMKRLCFVSSEAGSIARSSRTSWFSYCMSKGALNMAVKILFNDLRPQGYTFRLYHPGWVRTYMSGQKATQGDMEPEEAAGYAIPFFTDPFEDENHLALIDYQGQEYPW
jgi:NAD(P)-dependent dehydrogenase (short-subunit alcohol dehydrogenase family)